MTMREMETDILVVGGGLGGCAAAMAAAQLGHRVILTEPTRWVGGQATSQAVPPDEHAWIERFGCTARYRQFRNSVREYYRTHYPLRSEALNDPYLNPGAAWVSSLCHEPRVALAVIEQMLAPACSSGRLRILLRYEPTHAETNGDRVQSVSLRELDNGNDLTIEAKYFLDATELGDLLPLTGVEYVSGAESRDETGEPHAVDGPSQPDNVQAMTWCFPLAFDPTPGTDHTIDPPQQYHKWRNEVPQLMPPWTGPLLSWDAIHPVTMAPRRFELFDGEADPRNHAHSRSLWEYRRIIASQHYDTPHRPNEATIVNWPQNDYFEGNVIDKSSEKTTRYLEDAKQLSLSLVHWLQTEAPRPDGGCGYPSLHLRPDLVGTTDGMAQCPYFRESRRIRSLCTVTENHVGAEAREGSSAETFSDSIGIGYYRIDLHPSTGGNNYIDIASTPFQIPLGALLPVRVENLLPACKNIGTTHISNGCYRLHPVEWNIGEAAGLLAAWCLSGKTSPRRVREDKARLAHFQRVLDAQGIELAWPAEAIESVLREYADSTTFLQTS